MKAILALATAVTCIVLMGCHAEPHSYCHKLTTQINSSTNNSNTSNMNAATRARLTQEYKSLDCENQYQ